MSAFDDQRAELRRTEIAGANSGPYEPRWESLQAKPTPEWYQNAKFGIFVHWIVDAVPAFGSDWYARNMYIAGTEEFAHHTETFGAQSEFGYKDFIPKFSGDKFDADKWIELFVRAGAKYVVPVAEHHDGFAMYDSGLTRWKSSEMGPNRDVVGELASSARRHGLIFGVSNHRASIGGSSTAAHDLTRTSVMGSLMTCTGQPADSMNNQTKTFSLTGAPD